MKKTSRAQEEGEENRDDNSRAKENFRCDVYGEPINEDFLTYPEKIPIQCGGNYR